MKNEPLEGKQIRLANLRTLLAFLRTAIAFWGLGIALFHFINKHPYKAFGLISIAIGIIVVLWGIVEFFMINKYTDDKESTSKEID